MATDLMVDLLCFLKWVRVVRDPSLKEPPTTHSLEAMPAVFDYLSSGK